MFSSFKIYLCESIKVIRTGFLSEIVKKKKKKMKKRNPLKDDAIQSRLPIYRILDREAGTVIKRFSFLLDA